MVWFCFAFGKQVSSPWGSRVVFENMPSSEFSDPLWIQGHRDAHTQLDREEGVALCTNPFTCADLLMPLNLIGKSTCAEAPSVHCCANAALKWHR